MSDSTIDCGGRPLRWPGCLLVALVLATTGCATRPVNPPIEHYAVGKSYVMERPGRPEASRENLVILAFSGGGTRAAAFSYGVLEALRDIEVIGPLGRTTRLLDEVDVITGVSGGSFTALGYGLYGDKLFDIYEQRFLKRNVQGALISRFFNPIYWASMTATGRGRSDVAAELYDEILFDHATFADLAARRDAPLIAVSATDLSSGSRLMFTSQNFDVLCADLAPITLSRAAAASSAVPVALSPVTINNYGGSCGFQPPAWARVFIEAKDPPRPAQRVLSRIRELQEFERAKSDPYLHLVDGGVSDNLGLRGVLDFIETFEALHEAGLPTPLDHVKRIIVFVVNSLSSPATQWDRSEDPPSNLAILLKATGVPIDRYSSDAVELLKDTSDRWRMLRQIRDSAAFRSDNDPAVRYVRNAPDVEIFPVDVSFPRLNDAEERHYLDQLPTSFVLSDEAVDRLRAAARRIVIESPDFQNLLKKTGARMTVNPRVAPAASPASPAAP